MNGNDMIRISIKSNKEFERRGGNSVTLHCEGRFTFLSGLCRDNIPLAVVTVQLANLVNSTLDYDLIYLMTSQRDSVN